MESIPINSEMVAETWDGADKDKKNRLTKRSPMPTYLCHPIFLSFTPVAMEHLSPALLSPWRSQLRS